MACERINSEEQLIVNLGTSCASEEGICLHQQHITKEREQGGWRMADPWRCRHPRNSRDQEWESPSNMFVHQPPKAIYNTTRAK